VGCRTIRTIGRLARGLYFRKRIMSETRRSVRAATWAEDGDVIRSVRQDVFIREQAIPRELDFDGTDPMCVHALAFAGDEAVGTGRMSADGRIGRIAVIKRWRRQRIGSALVSCLAGIAGQRGLECVYLNSQKSAVGFYEAIGFVGAGEPFTEAGIEHIRMESTPGLCCS